MEELVFKFGFVITCLFFMCMLVIGSQFIWGVLVGMGIIVFGWYFSE